MSLYGRFEGATRRVARAQGVVVSCSFMSKQKTAVVILAAGQGARMKSMRPKVLHPIAGRPMIHYALEAASALDPDELVVVVDPGMGKLAEGFSPARTVVQKKPLGTADAVRAARATLEGFGGDVLVLFSDTPLISPRTLAAVLGALRKKAGTAVAALGFRPDEPGEYGRLILGSDGALERIVEYGDASTGEKAVTLCNSGVMAISGARLFELLDRVTPDNAKGEYQLTDIVRLASGQGRRCAAVEGDGEECLGVNSRADLAVAEAAMQMRLRGAAMAGGATLIDPTTVYFSFDTKLGRDIVIGPNVFFGPGVTVGNNVEIRAFCHIEGARIGDGAAIGPFARLRPGAEIGPSAHIGNFVEIKAARVEEGVKINHLTYVGDARVGRDANIGAGTITCNYDGFDKHFTDIGARVFIGSNTALVAPVVIGDGAVIGAGSVITGDVSKNALAVARAEQREIQGGAAKYRARKQVAKSQPSAVAKAPRKARPGRMSGGKG